MPHGDKNEPQKHANYHSEAFNLIPLMISISQIILLFLLHSPH
jgi:hypothetical protein